MLRLSRAEMTESAYKDGVVEQVYDGIVNYLTVESASIGFPELIVPASLQVGCWFMLLLIVIKHCSLWCGGLKHLSAADPYCCVDTMFLITTITPRILNWWPQNILVLRHTFRAIVP